MLSLPYEKNSTVRDKRLANVDKTKQSIYSVSDGYSVFFDLPDDCLYKAAPSQQPILGTAVKQLIALHAIQPAKESPPAMSPVE